MQNLPGPKIEPVCLALAGIFLSTGPPGKSTISFFIEVLLIYNVVLVSDTQQSDSVKHIYIYFFSFFSCHPCAGAMLIFSVSFQFQYMCCRSEHYISIFRFFSIIDYYKILNIVLCAIQQVIVYFVIQYCISVNLKLLIDHTHTHTHTHYIYYVFM